MGKDGGILGYKRLQQEIFNFDPNEGGDFDEFYAQGQHLLAEIELELLSYEDKHDTDNKRYIFLKDQQKKVEEKLQMVISENMFNSLEDYKKNLIVLLGHSGFEIGDSQDTYSSLQKIFLQIERGEEVDDILEGLDKYIKIFCTDIESVSEEDTKKVFSIMETKNLLVHLFHTLGDFYDLDETQQKKLTTFVLSLEKSFAVFGENQGENIKYLRKELVLGNGGREGENGHQVEEISGQDEIQEFLDQRGYEVTVSEGEEGKEKQYIVNSHRIVFTYDEDKKTFSLGVLGDTDKILFSGKDMNALSMKRFMLGFLRYVDVLIQAIDKRIVNIDPCYIKLSPKGDLFIANWVSWIWKMKKWGKIRILDSATHSYEEEVPGEKFLQENREKILKYVIDQYYNISSGDHKASGPGNNEKLKIESTGSKKGWKHWKIGAYLLVPSHSEGEKKMNE